MTETAYTLIDDAYAAIVRDFPDAKPCSALTAFLDCEVRFDAVSATVIRISDYSDAGHEGAQGEPDISLATISSR